METATLPEVVEKILPVPFYISMLVWRVPQCRRTDGTFPQNLETQTIGGEELCRRMMLHT